MAHVRPLPRISSARRSVSRATRSATLAAVVTAVVLTGCAMGAPEITPLPTSPAAEPTSTPTPTPEPTSGAYYAPEPQTEEEAIQQATEAYAFFLATMAEVYADPSDPTPIDEIAKQSAADGVRKSAQLFLDNGAEITLDDEFELDRARSYALPMRYLDDSTTDFGTVHMYGCLDGSKAHGTSGNGQPITFNEPRRAMVYVVLVYELDQQRWFVHSDTTDGEDELVEC